MLFQNGLILFLTKDFPMNFFPIKQDSCMFMKDQPLSFSFYFLYKIFS